MRLVLVPACLVLSACVGVVDVVGVKPPLLDGGRGPGRRPGICFRRTRLRHISAGECPIDAGARHGLILPVKSSEPGPRLVMRSG